jgi:hypothetical protein
MDNADISINTREKRDVLKIIGNDLSKNTILNFLGGAKNLISNIQFIPSKKIEEFKSELEEIKVQRTETINNLIKIFYNDVKEHGKTALTGYSLENAFHDLVKLGIDEKTFDNLLTLCFELSKNTFNACNWRVLHSFISYIRDFKIKSSKIDDFIKKMLTLKDIGEELLSAAMSYVYFVLGEDGESFVPIINSIIETASFGNKKNATILDRANKILDVINGTQKYPKNSFWEKS